MLKGLFIFETPNNEMSAEKLKPHLSKIRSPFGGEKVYKDECCYCFDTPVHLCSPLRIYALR